MHTMKAIEKKLLHFYRNMLDEDQHALLRYAEFLSVKKREQQSEQQTEVNVEIDKPELTSPKENESVVGALKRLSESYPMLDKAKMLDQTSILMSDHLVRGRSKEDVIKEFESLFEAQYKKLREIKSND